MNEAEEVLATQIKEATEALTQMETEVEAPVVEAKTEEVTSDPIVAQAIKEGWDPNFKGPNAKTAEQFVKDGSFFKKIDEQKKSIAELKKLFLESEARSKKIEQETRARTIAELQAAKEEAVAIADVDAYKRLEAQQAAEIKKANEVTAPTPVVPEIAPEYQQFAEKNKDWFNVSTPENELMAKTADGLEKVVADEARLNGETLTLSQTLERVEERIQLLFPKRFGNVNQSKPALVGGVSPAPAGKSGKLSDRLTNEQRNYIRKAREYGSTLTDEEYAKQLKSSGALRDE